MTSIEVVSYRNSTSNHNKIVAGLITTCCILSKFYIKPQHLDDTFADSRSCILSKFYIKPQLSEAPTRVKICCILSKFYIKPQQCSYCLVSFEVVSYRNSTSNHNYFGFAPILL